MCVSLCVGEQYCTKQDKCRLLTIRIIWGKTEKDLSLPCKGPHDCLPHIVSVQPWVSVCPTSVNLEQSPHWGFLCRHTAQASVKRCYGKVVCFLCCISFSLHIIMMTEKQRKIFGRWKVSPGGTVPWKSPYFWASPWLTIQTVVSELSF